MKMLQHILLVDDNEEDNEFHELVIKGANIAERVTSITVAEDAVEFLKNCFRSNERDCFPELIFLDMRMPRIDGFELLDILKKLLEENTQVTWKPKVFMLSGSYNPQLESALTDPAYNTLVLGYRIKPLTKRMLSEIIEKHFRAEDSGS
jgi:CheY-like chemotaxis protein